MRLRCAMHLRVLVKKRMSYRRYRPKRRVRSIKVPNEASIVSKILVDPTVVVVSLFGESVERVHGVNDRPARILGKAPDQPTGCQGHFQREPNQPALDDVSR